MSELLERHRRVIPNWLGLYYSEPLELTGGSGSRVTDASGRTYLDFFSGILTDMLGYDVPEVREAVQRQLDTGIVHTSTLYLIRNQVELAEKLARLSGIENAKVFFTNSGTEANETALMLATAARRSNQVLALRNSYHGRSFGAVAITGNGAWKSSRWPRSPCTTCTAPTGSCRPSQGWTTTRTPPPASRTCGTCWPPRPPGMWPA